MPYFALLEAFRPLCGSPDLCEIRDELHELPRLHPDLVYGTPLAPHSDGATAQLRLFAEVLAVLEHVSRRAPVVLLFEDLHWATDRRSISSPTSRTRSRGAACLSSRPTAATRSRPTMRYTASAPRFAGPEAPSDGRSSGLLADEDVEALVAASVDEALPAELTAAVCARAEGNPFFAIELAAAAASGEHDLPPALHDLLIAGIARLGADTRSVLRVVAAAGRDVP